MQKTKAINIIFAAIYLLVGFCIMDSVSSLMDIFITSKYEVEDFDLVPKETAINIINSFTGDLTRLLVLLFAILSLLIATHILVYRRLKHR